MTGLVRVTVASSTRRVDLALPGGVPLAELVPELARGVGLLDGARVHSGYHVSTCGGRELVPDAGLAAQGIEDGALLAVTSGSEVPPPRVHDDVAEAMAEVVERDLAPWSPAAGRRTALAAAGLLLALGLVALLALRGRPTGPLVAVVPVGVALVLVAGAVWLSRVRRAPGAAVALAWLGASYAAVAGLVLVPAGPLLGRGASAAGAGALLAGLACLLGMGPGRAGALPPLVAGAVFAGLGPAREVLAFDPPVVLTTVLVVLVVGSGALPSLALGVTGPGAGPVGSHMLGAEPVDLDRVAADARAAHELLLALTLAVGSVLVLVAPVAVSLGATGTLVAVLCAVLVLVRTRHHRGGAEVLAGLTAGILGLGSVAVAVVVLEPGWRPEAAVVLAVAGVVLLALAGSAPGPSPRRGRFVEFVETAALLAVPPALVVASGLLDVVRGWAR